MTFLKCPDCHGDRFEDWKAITVGGSTARFEEQLRCVGCGKLFPAAPADQPVPHRDLGPKVKAG